MVECAVIGAGQAGLSTSFHLSRLGVEHVVLERGRVGETWRTMRWDSFHLNTPNWCTQLPGLDLADADPDAFAPLDAVVDMLTGYATDIGAPVQVAAVTALRSSGDAFALELAGDTLAARSVVVATGAFQQPLTIRATGEPPAGVVQLQASSYRSPSDLPEGGVLIVGSGQSGCEIGLELLEAGREVHLAVGRCGWFPRRYRGRELMRWMVDVGAADETPEVLPTPMARAAGNVAVSGSRGGRDCNPLVLERAGARLYGRLEGFDAGRAVFARLEDGLEFGRTFERNLSRRCDEWAAASGLELPPAVPEAVRPRRTHDPTELALEGEGVVTVLWAGGFRPAFSWIDLPIFGADGLPEHEGGAVAREIGIYFVGLHFLYSMSSEMIHGVGRDADRIAGRVAERAALGQRAERSRAA